MSGKDYIVVNDFRVPLSDLNTEKKRREFIERNNNYHSVYESPYYFWKFDVMDIEEFGSIFRFHVTHRNDRELVEKGYVETTSHIREYFFIEGCKNTIFADYSAFDGSYRITTLMEEFKQFILKKLEEAK